jgi:hypothetical protein
VADLKLTDERIEVAARAIFNAALERNREIGIPIEGPQTWDEWGSSIHETYRIVARAAAPFLQAPWEMPTEKEAETLHANIVACGSDLRGMRHALTTFVEGRNLALLPKPVDPRRERLVAELMNARGSQFVMSHEEFADRILAAIDQQEVARG